MPNPEAPEQSNHKDSAERFAGELRARRASFGSRLGFMARDTDAVRSRAVLDWHQDRRGGRPAAWTPGVFDGADLVLSDPARIPLEISADHLRVGDVRVECYSTHIDDVLVAYLELIRALRGNPEASVVSFYTSDVDILADHLGWSGEAVVDQLATMVGTSQGRHVSMRQSYRSGKAVITSGLYDERAPQGVIDRNEASGTERLQDLLEHSH